MSYPDPTIGDMVGDNTESRIAHVFEESPKPSFRSRPPLLGSKRVELEKIPTTSIPEQRGRQLRALTLEIEETRPISPRGP